MVTNPTNRFVAISNRGQRLWSGFAIEAFQCDRSRGWVDCVVSSLLQSHDYKAHCRAVLMWFTRADNGAVSNEKEARNKGIIPKNTRTWRVAITRELDFQQ